MRRQLGSDFEKPEWSERKTIDAKIGLIEALVKRRKSRFEAYQMGGASSQPRSPSLVSDGSFDFNRLAALVQDEPVTITTDVEVLPSLSAPSISSMVPSMSSPVISATASNPREELLMRRRPIVALKVSATADIKKPAYQEEHDSLTTDLVVLAQNLKRNNLAFQGLLKNDSSVIKESELLLNTNSAKFNKEHEGLKGFRRSSWKSTWKTILMVFMLLGAFVAMYLLIKVTSKRQ